MTAMINVLFLSHDSSLYGAQLSLLGLLSRLNQCEIGSRVVAPYAGPLTEAITDLGIPVDVRLIKHWIAAGNGAKNSRLKIAYDFFSGLKPRVWALAKLIERYDIDIVYTNTVILIEGALAARITGRPHVWHLREQISDNSQLISPVPAWIVSRIVGRLSARVIVNSRYLGQAYTCRETIKHMSFHRVDRLIN